MNRTLLSPVFSGRGYAAVLAESLWLSVKAFSFLEALPRAA